MSESKDVWKICKAASDNKWIRLEDKLNTGFPDCIVLDKYCTRIFVELKEAHVYKKNNYIAVKLSIPQANYLEMLKKNHSSVYVIARICDDFYIFDQKFRSLTEKKTLSFLKKICLCKLNIKNINEIDNYINEIFTENNFYGYNKHING